MKQYDRIPFEIWGKKFDLKVFTSNLKYDDKWTEVIEPLNSAEISEVDWIRSLNIGDEIMNSVIKWCDACYYAIGEPEINEVFPEVELTSIYVKTWKENTYVALLGECKCDIEHGISIVFKNRQFDGIGQYSDLF